MKHAIRTAFAFAFASLCLCSGAHAKIVSFQIPRAVLIGIAGMNDKGQVAGTYGDDQGGVHGFLFAAGGAVATFDVPGATVTRVTGISAAGEVTGWYVMAMSSGSFVRAADGSIMTFSSTALGINAKSWIVGAVARKRNQTTAQGFLRDPTGATQHFPVPGEAHSSYSEVVNRTRMIAGVAKLESGLTQGFIRPAHGTATLFGDLHNYVDMRGINDAGTIAGAFGDQQRHYTAFVRTSDGAITTFDGPNGTIDTEVWGINNTGTVAGAFSSDGTYYHGFLRTADGTFMPFDIKGAYRTDIIAINDKGVIAGDYFVSHLGVFGFVGKP